MDDKLKESRENYGRQFLPRLFSREADDKKSEIHERYLGAGIAVGTPIGLAVGAAFGVAFGNFASGISLGICIGTGVGIAVGSSLGEQHARAAQATSE